MNELGNGGAPSADPGVLRCTRCATTVQPPATKLNAPRAMLMPYVVSMTVPLSAISAFVFVSSSGRYA